MVQETVVAEGTSSMFSESDNAGIADLAQQDLHITNLDNACSSGGPRRSRRSRRTRRSRRSRRSRSRRSRNESP